MCIAVLALGAHADFPFVLMHNRDEFYARSAEPLARWKENPAWMAGRDLQGDGMWLAFSDAGDFGFVTNYRDPARHRQDRKSRGAILREYLEGDRAPGDYVRHVAAEARAYNPFNLVLGRIGGDAFFLNSLDATTIPLGPGIHAVSNARLETPWPKLKRARALFGDALKSSASRDWLETRLFAALADTTPAPDAELPNTGLSRELERLVSSIFIRSANYGTRSSTIAVADLEGRLKVAETTFGPHASLSHNSLASVLPRP